MGVMMLCTSPVYLALAAGLNSCRTGVYLLVCLASSVMCNWATRSHVFVICILSTSHLKPMHAGRTPHPAAPVAALPC